MVFLVWRAKQLLAMANQPVCRESQLWRGVQTAKEKRRGRRCRAAVDAAVSAMAAAAVVHGGERQ
jgi:hypothetical protein